MWHHVVQNQKHGCVSLVVSIESFSKKKHKYPQYILHLFQFESEAPLPGPIEPRDGLSVDLTDLELFKKYCMPVIMRDPWDDVSYLKSLGEMHGGLFLFSLLDTPEFLFHM